MTCVKQTVTATITNNGNKWVGSNVCLTPQDVCPREELNLPTGVGYELCSSVCNQKDHAEVNVLTKAKDGAWGGHLSLQGHTYCCDNCLSSMQTFGIKTYSINSDHGDILESYTFIDGKYVLDVDK
jgi:hypothetical protein